MIAANRLLEKDVPVPPLRNLAPFHLSYAQGLFFDDLASGSTLIVSAF